MLCLGLIKSVVTAAQTHAPGHGTAYQCSDPNLIPLSYPGTPTYIGVNLAAIGLF